MTNTKSGKTKERFIRWFSDIRIEDTGLVGGKNAALGEMLRELVPLGVNVPNGFAITAEGYRYFLDKAGLAKKIKQILTGLDTHNIKDLSKRGHAVRKSILGSNFPPELSLGISAAYRQMGKIYGTDTDVAIRSSATAEDLPGASFAGQQDTYLNIKGENNVHAAVKRCFASLFNDRAISYRVDKGFSHFDVALSVGIQKMVRSDIGSSGVAFTIDTETGFDKVVVINSAWGLGEIVVQGKVIPDEFVVFKPALEKGYTAIISKKLGKKTSKVVYAPNGTLTKPVNSRDQKLFSLDDKDVLALGRWCVEIEKHFSEKRERYQPMDIEWAKDGKTKELFIVQARPETVYAIAEKNVYNEYRLKQMAVPIISGIAVGVKVASGRSRVLKSAREITKFQKGEVLVTRITDPDWEPIMKVASAIVTDEGGRTSHAAIVSRELGIPCIVGTLNATKTIKNGDFVTVDCSSGEKGYVYHGKIPFEVITHKLDAIPETKTKVMVNIGSPDEAFKNHYLPARGVGLGRLEFIIASKIQIHPNALLEYKKLKAASSKDSAARNIVRKIDELSSEYADKKQYYIYELAEGIAKIGAAFWPHDVIIRFSDFKTNEYRALVGGERYEPAEENPMIGWRGASRYYEPRFREAFGLECQALLRARGVFGLTNIVPMIPFCRTPEEGKRVVEIMRSYGLDREKDPGLKIYVMCEIPSNVVLADAFLDVFDGFSIGSNDLTQLILGLDRDSEIVAAVGNENNEAVKEMIGKAIDACKRRGKYIGICGQAPSDFPEFTDFLVSHGIESISLNPDTVIKMILRIHEHEG